MDKSNRYMMRGVSAAKEDVHNAIKNIDKGIFPQAFCKIIPDVLGYPQGAALGYVLIGLSARIIGY